MGSDEIRDEAVVEGLSPVRRLPTDPPGDDPAPGVALCLSGGGYRAMLFHLGVLWRLNEAGLLAQLKRVSSVSGGSITAGALGLNWPRLGFDEKGVAARFEAEVVQPVRELAGETIDVESVLGGIFLPGSIADKVAGAYRKALFDHHTLQDLPAPPGPVFVINATNVQSGALWRFRRDYMADYHVGMVPNPRVELAVAVAASSAFPPVLSPLRLELDEADFTPNSGENLQFPPYTTEVWLTDGGVYDNLGLETAWKRYQTIFVSDGGGKMAPEPEPDKDWARHTLRVLNLIDNQVRSLRKRQLIDSFVNKERGGAYWGIMTDYRQYAASSPALPCPFEATSALAGIPTRLARMEPVAQERLMNWGYAECDAALRTYFDPALPQPGGFIYPDAGVGA
jgi:NTE family protein